MEKKLNVVQVPTISALYEYMGFPMLDHPSFAMLKIEEVGQRATQIPALFSYNFYAVGFKKNLTGYIKYGRQTYDFQEGVLLFTAPNQILGFESLISDKASGWYLFFHQDLLRNHPLTDRLARYGFFDYKVNEALHLSEREEMEVENLFEGLYREYRQPIDTLSKELIASSLDVLFIHAERFYKRQFITRDEVDSSVLIRFKKELETLLDNEQLIENGIPRVTLLAEKMNLSPNYLSDLLKTNSGKSTIEHIHYEILERSKRMILSGNKRISEIAYDLGFEYPQYFSRFFRERIGMSPTEFRNSMN